MSLLNEINPLDENKIADVLMSIYSSNLQEDFYIKKEYQMTLDLSGNTVYIDDEKEEGKSNIESVISSTTGSKE